MSLTAALNVGRTGLIASQAAIETAGNNISNSATRGYHRQTVALSTVGSLEVGSNLLVGRGVKVQALVQNINEALESRLRDSLSNESASVIRQDLLEQVQSLENELSDSDLSSQLAQFFSAFSELANRPGDNSLRTAVVQEGHTLATVLQGRREELVGIRRQVDDTIDATAGQVNALLDRVASLNPQIAKAEVGGGVAADLRDQRGIALAELAGFMDISTHENPSTGVVDVFVDSTPIVLNGKSRGVELRRTAVDGALEVDYVVAADGTPLQPDAGSIGALVAAREQDVQGAIDALDTFTYELIRQVNLVHSQGQGAAGFTEVVGATRVGDPDAVLNSDEAALAFEVGHGSFAIHLTQTLTGERTSSRINIDLDGIGPGSDTTLTSLAAQINAVDGITATVTPRNQLKLSVDTPGFSITFTDDSAGVLAALGINTYFTGENAQDIAVNAILDSDPSLLAAGQEHVPGDNRNALALAGLRAEPIAGLSGSSLTDFWARHVADFAQRLSLAEQSAQSDTIVRESLEAQQQQVSGVNIDEETIDLLTFQRAYQGSARFISVVDEMFTTLLSLI